MAGGGAAAAASALSSPWRALLQRALDANAHLRHSTYFQLVSFDNLLPSSVLGKMKFAELSIRRRPRWAPAAGRPIAPSCSGIRGRAVLRTPPSILCRTSFYLEFEFVIRSFQEHSDKIQINTDARSNKVCC